MPKNFKGRLKSENSGFRKRERTEETADTPQLIRQNVKGTKTGNNSLSQLSKTDTPDVFTDYDAVEIFNRVLLKKCFERDS
jgi:hypothetical protein